MPNNARKAIETLLTTATSPGAYCSGAEMSNCPIPEVRILGEGGQLVSPPLSFPLGESDIATIKAEAERAGVGMPDRTVVNLDVRKTWQIKPGGLSVSNTELALERALWAVQRDLGTATDYRVEAHLYKLLLYEEGCFFARHRDNERLDGMFGTLVLELPSTYEGAELAVWSPLTPNEKTVFANGAGPKQGSRRRTRSGKPKMHFTAFYADCYHEVSKLTHGHRVALVYHLTARPAQPRVLPHLPEASLLPPQPAGEGVALDIANLMKKFANETDGDYPKMWESSPWRNQEWPGKPKKLALVLSHHYTPASLTGLSALKGTDRSVAELICAAAFRRPGQDLTSLTRLAAKALVEGSPEDYTAASADHFIHKLVSDEYDKPSDEEGPYFDAALALAMLWDHGEFSPRSEDEGNGFRTTGPLISLTSKSGGSVPLDMGPERPNDRNAEYHPSLFGDGYGSFGLYAVDPNGPGNHSLPIFSHEILFASPEAAEKFRLDEDGNGTNYLVRNSPKEVEFLGNGMPYPGRAYSRAVILIWPKANREAVQKQSKGGRGVLSGKRTSE